MRRSVFLLAVGLAAVTALGACRVRIPPKYDNKPVAPASAPVQPEAPR